MLILGEVDSGDERRAEIKGTVSCTCTGNGLRSSGKEGKVGRAEKLVEGSINLLTVGEAVGDGLAAGAEIVRGFTTGCAGVLCHSDG